MAKSKYIIITILASILLLLAPNIVNAASEQTYKDDTQNIEWTYELDKSGNVINLKCNTIGKTGKVEIPSQINGQTVISLKGAYGEGAFLNCAGITEVTIPNTITTIGSYAFEGCTGLKNIVIPDSVTKIESCAFRNCSGLTSITFSQNLTSIGDNAFANCTGLKSVTIPDSVTSIDIKAFINCSGIKELTLSNHLSKIDFGTFENCSSLTSVKLPDSVTTIKAGTTVSGSSGAFKDCKNLQKILIPDTVATIDEGVFDGCSKLTIYGNDDMVSKQYAEENKIPFDYIANWDKASSGSDITAPTVENIQVTYASVMNYSKDANKNMYMVPAQAKLVINVIFSEVVEGTTAPTLTIKFGDGQNIQVTEGTVGGSTITYIYTVKSTDKGVMTTVDYKGGNIKDAAGNAATLSCPALTVQNGDFVYANGTATNPNNNGSSNNGGSTSDGSNGKNTDGNDKTVATGNLPYAGVNLGLIILLISTITAGILSYFKIVKYKNI